MDIEKIVKDRLGDKYFLVRIVEGEKNRCVVSDGEYEYVVSTLRGMAARRVDRNMMTKESLLKMYQKTMPTYLTLVDFYKTNGRYVYIVKDNEFGTIVEQKSNRGVTRSFRAARYKIDKVRNLIFYIDKIYGGALSYVRRCDKVCGNIIATDGTYEYSVTRKGNSPSKISEKSMTKESNIQYRNSMFKDHITVVDIYVVNKQTPYLKIVDKRTNRVFNFRRLYSVDYIESVIENDFKIVEAFFLKAKNKFGDKIKYDRAIYRTMEDYITINCARHGYVEVRPHSFLKSKHGCPICGRSKIGYARSDFIHACSDRDGLLYAVEMEFEDERFLKIGITSNGLHKRFITEQMPYIYKEICCFYSDGENIWNEEKKMHRMFSKHKYRPRHNFGGVTECFEIGCKADVIEAFSKL